MHSYSTNTQARLRDAASYLYQPACFASICSGVYLPTATLALILSTSSCFSLPTYFRVHERPPANSLQNCRTLGQANCCCVVCVMEPRASPGK